MAEIPRECQGWWRIVETSPWVNKCLDCLPARVNCKPTKTGMSFTREGAWELDAVSGSGSVPLGKDGRLRGRIKVKDGDESPFIAERAKKPANPMADPPSYRDQWKRRW
jgi:hypothetical protein